MKGSENLISIITLDETEKWDTIVKSFVNHDVYYLSGYTKAFMLHGDGEPILIYYNNKDIRAMNVVMKRDIGLDNNFRDVIALNTFFDLSTPYGYGGFIFDGNLSIENIIELNNTYTNYCFENNIISEIVRFHPVLENSKVCHDLYEILDLGKTITIDLESKEKIWSNLSGKNRNVIRKSIKSGVKVYWGRSQELVNQFIPLYNSTMRRDNAIDYYYFNASFYESILNDFKFNNMFFYAVFEDKIISSSMILFGNKNMHYHLSASDKEYQFLAATNLLLYEAACWGYENGYKKFHLGGGLGSKEDSLFKFKEAFYKKSETYFSIGKKIFNPEKYDELLKIRGLDFNNSNTTYFPQYRKQ